MLKQLVAAGLLISGLALTATAGNAAGYMMSASPAPTPVSAMAAAPPAHRSHGVLVDGRGMTLYTYAADPPGQSTCFLTCAIAWPPFFAPVGAQASGRWSIVPHGMRGVWAYNGHALYFWIKDHKPGDVTGDNVEGFHVAH